MKWIPFSFLVCAVTATAVGCASAPTSDSATASASTSPSSSIAPAPAPAPTPASASNDDPCAGGQFARQQFVGDWKDEDGTQVTTLGADGTLTSLDGGTPQSGKWSYTPWEDSPAKDGMPASATGQCVLALSFTDPAPAMNLVYAPLKATNTTLTLSYIGRGNTITWVRAANSQ